MAARLIQPEDRLPLLALAGVVLALFGDLLVLDRALFSRDIHLMWYTSVETLVRSVANGTWPAWNPFINFGQPLWADANNQILYPTTWLHLFLRPWTYYSLFVCSHLLFAGCGLYFVARRLDLRPAAAFFAGAMWIASGPMQSIVEMWNQLAGVAWLPWAMLAARGAFVQGSARHACLWGLCHAAQVLAGAPEMALMGGGGAIAFALLEWRRAGAHRPRLAHAVLFALGALAVAFGLSAGQWLPALDIATQSARRDLPGVMRSFWSVHPVGILQAFLPVPLHDLYLTPHLRRVLFEGREPLFLSLDLGLPGLALAAAAFYGKHRGLAVGLLACFILAIALSFGRHTPLLGWLVAAFPPFAALRYPVKAMVGASVAFALLVGLGISAAMDQRLSTHRGLRAGTLAILALGASVCALAALVVGPGGDIWGPLLVWSPSGHFTPRSLLEGTLIRFVVTGSLTAAVLTLALWRPVTRARMLTRIGAVSALALAELVTIHFRLVPRAPRALYTHRPGLLELAKPSVGQRLYVYDYGFTGRSQAHLGRDLPFRLARAPVGWPGAAANAFALRLYLIPPSAGAWGLEGSYGQDTPGIAPIRQWRINELLIAAEGTPAHLRLLQLAGVGRVIALHKAGFEGLELLTQVNSLLAEPIYVFGVPDPLPRAYAVSGARVPEGDDVVLALLDSTFRPRSEILVDWGASRPPATDFHGVARILYRTANTIDLTATLSSAGYVVVLDAYDRNWTARVDGVDAPLVRANAIFMAVPVAAGHHEVALTYKPPWIPVGLAISAATLVVLGACLLRRRGSRRREP